jgi:glycosyl transferase family 25
MKIFILHCSKLVERKKHILEQFNKQGIVDYEFIEKYDKDEIPSYESNFFDTNFIKSQRSLILKHYYVYNIIAEKYDCALIFEDDVIICDNFINKLNNYVSQLPKNYDMLFIGDGCNLHIKKDKLIPNKNIYEKCLWEGGGATRCTDSYIITKAAANKLFEYIKNLNYKINLPIDFFLNTALKDNNFKVYWAEPTIVTQGSESGMFESSLV